MTYKQWRNPTPDELLAGRIWAAAGELNLLMQDAAREGLQTEVLVSDYRDADNHPSTAWLHGQCYRRQDVVAIRIVETE